MQAIKQTVRSQQKAMKQFRCVDHVVGTEWALR